MILYLLMAFAIFRATRKFLVTFGGPLKNDVLFVVWLIWPVSLAFIIGFTADNFLLFVRTDYKRHGDANYYRKMDFEGEMFEGLRALSTIALELFYVCIVVVILLALNYTGKELGVDVIS